MSPRTGGEWRTQLLELGLLRRSVAPTAAQPELRDVGRYRKRLIEERAREANRPFRRSASSRPTQLIDAKCDRRTRRHGKPR